MGSEEPIIRRMTADDIAFGLRLVEIAGWNQCQTDWQRIFDLGPDGCFVATVENQPVGTITSTCYGTDLAWIGMMLVDPAFRRRGIATILMKHLLDWLQQQSIRCIKLDATPAGVPIYESLGFQAEWSYHRYLLDTNDCEENSFRSEQQTLNHDLDTQAFGADRSAILAKLSEVSNVVALESGFGMVRPGRLASYLGPVIAADPTIAKQLFADLLRVTSAPVFCDVPEENLHAKAVVEELGFRKVRPLTRMWLGNDLIETRMELQYAIASPAIG